MDELRNQMNQTFEHTRKQLQGLSNNVRKLSLQLENILTVNQEIENLKNNDTFEISKVFQYLAFQQLSDVLNIKQNIRKFRKFDKYIPYEIKAATSLAPCSPLPQWYKSTKPLIENTNTQLLNIYSNIFILFKSLFMDNTQYSILLQNMHHKVNNIFISELNTYNIPIDLDTWNDFFKNIDKYHMTKLDLKKLHLKIQPNKNINKENKTQLAIDLISTKIEQLSSDEKRELFYPSNASIGKKGYKSQIADTIKDSNDKSLFEKTYNKEWDQNFFNYCWNKAREISKDLYKKQH